MADGLLGILWHQGFQIGLGSLVVQKCLPCAAEYACNFRPRIRRAHIDDPDGLDSWLWRFDTEQARRLATLHTAPELPFSSDNEVLVERVRVGGDLDPFAAAGDHRENSASSCNHPHVVLQ